MILFISLYACVAETLSRQIILTDSYSGKDMATIEKETTVTSYVKNGELILNIELTLPDDKKMISNGMIRAGQELKNNNNVIGKTLSDIRFLMASADDKEYYSISGKTKDLYATNNSYRRLLEDQINNNKISLDDLKGVLDSFFTRTNDSNIYSIACQSEKMYLVFSDLKLAAIYSQSDLQIKYPKIESDLDFFMSLYVLDTSKEKELIDKISTL